MHAAFGRLPRETREYHLALCSHPPLPSTPFWIRHARTDFWKFEKFLQSFWSPCRYTKRIFAILVEKNIFLKMSKLNATREMEHFKGFHGGSTTNIFPCHGMLKFLVRFSDPPHRILRARIFENFKNFSNRFGHPADILKGFFALAARFLEVWKVPTLV